MSEHSVTEAAMRLSDLIDRALSGEGVVITRDGTPIAELKPIQSTGRPMTEVDLAWLEKRRVGSRMPEMDAGELVSRLRDEGER